MEDNKKGPVKETLSCSVCERKFDRKSRLAAHYKTHTGERPFNCPYCSKSFASKGNCNTHVRVHTRERPYVCQYCEKRFSQHGQMVIHVRRHTGEKPYVCPHCKKGFACSKVLKIHVRTHTGEKPYVCDFCSKGFAAYANLVVHRRIHTRERPYTCKLCGRSFEHSGNLVRHERGHHVDGGIRCIPCGRLFQQSKDLGVHMNSSHPNDVSKEDMEDQGIDVVSTDSPKSVSTPENIWSGSQHPTHASSPKDLSKEINKDSNNNKTTDVVSGSHKIKEEFRQESPDSGCATVSDEDEVCKDLDVNRYFLEAGNTSYRRELVQRQLSLLPVCLSKTNRHEIKESFMKSPVSSKTDNASFNSLNCSHATSFPQQGSLNLSIQKSVENRTMSEPWKSNANNFHHENSNTQSRDLSTAKSKFGETLTDERKHEAAASESSVLKTGIHSAETISTSGLFSTSNSQSPYSPSQTSYALSSPSTALVPKYSSASSSLTPSSTSTTPITDRLYTEGGEANFIRPSASAVTGLSTTSPSRNALLSPPTPSDLSLTGKISAATGNSSSIPTKETYPIFPAQIETSRGSSCRVFTSNTIKYPGQNSITTVKNLPEDTGQSHQSIHLENSSMPINLSINSTIGQNAIYSATGARYGETELKDTEERESGSCRKRKLSSEFTKDEASVKCTKTMSSPQRSPESPAFKSHDPLPTSSSNSKHASNIPRNISTCETDYNATCSYERTKILNATENHYGNGSSSVSTLPSSTSRIHSVHAKDGQQVKGLLNLVPSSSSALKKEGENSEHVYPLGKDIGLNSHVHHVKMRNIRESIRMSVSHICPAQQDKKSFKSNVETALIALLGTSTIAHLAHPNKNAEQVLVNLLDLAGMTPCADVRVDEDERLRVNMRKLLEYGFPEPSAWRSLGWHQETIETITEKIATWSIAKQWRQSKNLAAWASSQADPKHKIQVPETNSFAFPHQEASSQEAV